MPPLLKLIAAMTLIATSTVTIISGDLFGERLGSAVIAEMRKAMKLQQNWDPAGNAMRYLCPIPTTYESPVFKSTYRLSRGGMGNGPAATLEAVEKACTSSSLKLDGRSSQMTEQDCKALVAATLSNERLCGRRAKGRIESLEEVRALFAPDSYRGLADAIKSKVQAKLGLVVSKAGIPDCPKGTRFCFRCKDEKFSLLHCTTDDNDSECKALSKKPAVDRPAGTLSLDDFGEICAKATLFETPAECLAYLSRTLSPSFWCNEKEIDSLAAWIAPINPDPKE